VRRKRRNWSGSIGLQADRHYAPRNEDEIAEIVRAVAQRCGRLRVVGSAHSSSGILGGADSLLHLGDYRGLISADRERGQAWVRAGTTLADLGRDLYEHDLALPNYGDIALQTLAGAVSTGTHGTGLRLQNLAQMVREIELVDADGRLHRLRSPRELAASRVALGSLGVMTRLLIDCVPTFDVERREYACSVAALMEALPELVRGNRSFDFYWYPRRDEVKLRLVNPFGGGTSPPDGARMMESVSGYGHQIIPTHSGLQHRFEESEYALPVEQGPACFLEVRERILRRWRRCVGWRVLYRTVAADDGWISPAGGRASATISLHQNASLPWRDYFDDLAPLFDRYAGRPHWAKKHSVAAARLRELYPRWDDFLAHRAALDPQGVFLSPALSQLFGLDAAGRAEDAA
jgi:FAD/FMN-containing dehydrogenase